MASDLARGGKWARLRRDGIAATIRKAWRDHVFRREISYIFRMSPISSRFAAYRDALDDGFTWVRLDDPTAIPPLGGWLAHRHDDFVALLALGQYGLLAMVDGAAIGCVWAATRDFRDVNSGLSVRVPPGSVYVYGMMIDHNHRKSRLAYSLCVVLLADMRDLGVGAGFSYCDVANEASYRLHLAMGCAETGELLTEYIILGRNFARVSRYQGLRAPASWRPSR